MYTSLWWKIVAALQCRLLFSIALGFPRSFNMVCVALLFSILVTSVLAPGVIGQDATGDCLRTNFASATMQWTQLLWFLGADDQRPPEETADAIVDPQIVSGIPKSDYAFPSIGRVNWPRCYSLVEGQDGDPVDSRLAERLQEALSNLEKIVNQGIERSIG